MPPPMTSPGPWSLSPVARQCLGRGFPTASWMPFAAGCYSARPCRSRASPNASARFLSWLPAATRTPGWPTIWGSAKRQCATTSQPYWPSSRPRHAPRPSPWPGTKASARSSSLIRSRPSSRETHRSEDEPDGSHDAPEIRETSEGQPDERDEDSKHTHRTDPAHDQALPQRQPCDPGSSDDYAPPGEVLGRVIEHEK